MKFSYDPKYNVAYLRFSSKKNNVHTVAVTPELNVDLNSDGSVYGIELLNANTQLEREDFGKILMVNEGTGQQAELPLN